MWPLYKVPVATYMDFTCTLHRICMYFVVVKLDFPREPSHSKHGLCLPDSAILGVKVMLARTQTKVTGKGRVRKPNKARVA